MSFMLKPMHAAYLNNKKKEDFLFPNEDGYDFKYISGKQFKYIAKNVQRQRRRDQEEFAWAQFVKQQELESFSPQDAESLEEDNVCRSTIDIEPPMPSYLTSANGKGNETSRTVVIKNVNSVENDIFLSIPGEESSYEESLKTRRSCNVRRTSSDHNIRGIIGSKQIQPLHDMEYNSSPELSSRHEHDKEDDVPVRPDPEATHRILLMQKKISELLDEISFRLGKIPLPDGDIDLKRRQQRVMEFSVRLSRNYLYNLNRYISDIQKHVCTISPSVKIKLGRRGITFHMQIIEQKLIAAHQLLLHALSAYCKHLPSSVLQGHTEKIKEILKIVLDLKNICDKIQLTTNYFSSGDTCVLPLEKDTQSKCNAILSKLKLNSENESQFDGSKGVSNTTVSSNALKAKKNCKRKCLVDRFKMYNMEMKLSRHFKKKPGNHRSEEKRRTPLVTKFAIKHCSSLDRPNPSPVTNPSSRELILNENTDMMCFKEDDIKTMMDTVPIDSDNDRNHEMYSKRSSNAQLSKTVRNSLNKFCTAKHRKSRSNEINRNESTVRLTSRASIESFPADHKEKYTSNRRNCTRINCTNASKTGTQSRTKNDRNEGNGNTRNMQLICMSSSDKPLESREGCDTPNNIDNWRKEVHQDRSKSILLWISKKVETALLCYKTEYENRSKQSPMYSSNTNNKPWDIVSWISDKLVDELISEITKELEMGDVIQKLLQLEFQEF